MLHRKLRALLVGSLGVVSGCGAGLDIVTSDPANYLLSTDRASYTAVVAGTIGSQPQYGFTVITAFTNRAKRMVYLARCAPSSPTPMFSVEMVGSAEPPGPAYNGVWACTGHDQQIPVAAGATRSDTLFLVGPNSFDGATGQPIGALTGAMRLRYTVQTCQGDGACVVQDAGNSNSFAVALHP